MNSFESQIFVYLNSINVAGLKLGQPSLFLLSHDAVQLLEEPTIFLHEHYVQSGRRQSPNTWEAAAHALKSWVEFLIAIGVSCWRDAGRDDLICYRDSYKVAISPRTGQAYASSTIGNRMGVVLEFYKYAGEKGWYDGDLILHMSNNFRDLNVPIDDDALAYTRRGRRMVKKSSNLIPRRRKSRTNIRPFMVSELHILLLAVGPRAAERDGDDRPVRNRLMFDMGWAVGLRLDEIHQLTSLQFLSMHPDPDQPLGYQALTVIGKGEKKRIVAIPNWLVHDALTYINDERSVALKAGKVSSRTASTALFLSGKESKNPGQPITHRRMQQVMDEVCIASGLVESIEISDPITGEVVQIKKAKHCVHDLRHTYAVLTYWAEKRAGNVEPWKKIQSQLGHEYLTTTINTYLSFVEIFGESQRLTDIRKLIWS